MSTSRTQRGPRSRVSWARVLATAILAAITLSACSNGPSDPGTPISPILVGNNVWMSPTQKMWDKTAAAGLTLMRIGGTSYDEHVPQPVLLDAWVKQIRTMGAEPLMQVSRFADPQEAADLVTHFNVDSDQPITYWSIGNEPDCGTTTARTALGIAAYIKPIATAMKAVDPTITIYAPDACDYIESLYRALFSGHDGPADISGLIPGTKNYYVDGVSWHRYVGYPPENITTDGLTTAGVSDFLTRMKETRALVDDANTARGRTGANALHWGLTEFNAVGKAVCSFENGQMFAQIYGDLMKYGATMGATWSIAENAGSCSSTDFGFLDRLLNPRSTYLHMQMVDTYITGSYLGAQSSVDSIRSYGAVDKDNTRVSVMLMNIGTTDAQACTVTLQTPATSGSGCAVSLPAGIDAKTSVSMPPQSTTVLVFDLDGTLTRTVTYAKGDDAPTVTDKS